MELKRHLNLKHIVFSVACAFASVGTMFLKDGLLAALLITLLVNLYVLTFLIEISFAYSHKFKSTYLLALPSRSTGILIFFLVLVSLIFSFASLFSFHKLFPVGLQGRFCRPG